MHITQLMLRYPVINVNRCLLRVLYSHASTYRTTTPSLKGSLGSIKRSQTLCALIRFNHVDHKPKFRFLEKLNLDEPLRILFCGSDEFSAESLRQLYLEKTDNPDLIESIHVVIKAGKPAGRGLKEIRDVPLKSVARELSLPLSELHTFTGWTPPSSNIGTGATPNLVIAVSFGLLVPPRILSASRYGGLNVHPSLLPDFRGPAPLQWTMLEGRKRSGITVQSLHPKHFDGGRSLAQDTFDVPKNGECTFDELLNTVTPAAGKLLVSTLRKGSFRVNPHEASLEEERVHQVQQGTYARKITSADTMIDWDTWHADKILRYQRALGDLSGYAAFADLRNVWDKPLQIQQRLESCTVHRAKWSGFRVLPINILSSAGAVRLKVTQERLRELGPEGVKTAAKDAGSCDVFDDLEKKPLMITWENIVKVKQSGQKYILNVKERDMSVRAQGLAHVVGSQKTQAFEFKRHVLLIRTCDGQFLMPDAVKLPGAKGFQDMKRVALSEMKKTGR
ncbi:MAG: Methionyl-tRNA formyltransferase [Alyxoria varia]|nr:MAG: Methionyl-tRNA formyltransferase [Alyxoria varia]